MWRTNIWTEWRQYPPEDHLEPVTHWVVTCSKAMAIVLRETGFTVMEGVYPVTRPADNGTWEMEWLTFTVPTDEDVKRFQEALAEVEMKLNEFRIYLRAINAINDGDSDQ